MRPVDRLVTRLQSCAAAAQAAGDRARADDCEQCAIEVQAAHRTFEDILLTTTHLLERAEKVGVTVKRPLEGPRVDAAASASTSVPDAARRYGDALTRCSMLLAQSITGTDFGLSAPESR